MNTDQTTPEGIPDAGAGKPHPAISLLNFVETELTGVEDVYKNLLTEYDDSIYEKFEQRFIDLRNTFKGKLKDMSDEHYELIKRSDLKKEVIEKVIQYATDVAERFQEARENKRLDRPRTTDPLEDLIIELKNLRHVIEVQAK